MDAKLKVIDGAKPSEIQLKLPTIIGRGAESSLRVPQSQVSRSHCEVYEEDGLLAVFDLGSSNGSFVNGEKIDEPTFLYPGDRLRIGSVTLEAIYEANVDSTDSSGSTSDASTDEPAEAETEAPAEEVAVDADETPEPIVKSPAKAPARKPAAAEADATASGLSGVAAIVDYSENSGGSFIAISSLGLETGGPDTPADVSAIALDTGEDAGSGPEVSSFQLGEEEGKPTVEGGDSALNDFFRNLE